MFRNPLTDGIVVLIVLLLFFGPKRLPELGRGIGEGIRSFKDGIGGGSSAEEDSPQLPEQSDASTASPPPETAQTGSERRS
jgi:sec-independent protein translocase protein TatA